MAMTQREFNFFKNYIQKQEDPKYKILKKAFQEDGIENEGDLIYKFHEKQEQWDLWDQVCKEQEFLYCKDYITGEEKKHLFRISDKEDDTVSFNTSDSSFPGSDLDSSKLSEVSSYYKPLEVLSGANINSEEDFLTETESGLDEKVKKTFLKEVKRNVFLSARKESMLSGLYIGEVIEGGKTWIGTQMTPFNSSKGVTHAEIKEERERYVNNIDNFATISPKQNAILDREYTALRFRYDLSRSKSRLVEPPSEGLYEYITELPDYDPSASGQDLEYETEIQKVMESLQAVVQNYIHQEIINAPVSVVVSSKAENYREATTPSDLITDLKICQAFSSDQESLDTLLNRDQLPEKIKDFIRECERQIAVEVLKIKHNSQDDTVAIDKKSNVFRRALNKAASDILKEERVIAANKNANGIIDSFVSESYNNPTFIDKINKMIPDEAEEMDAKGAAAFDELIIKYQRSAEVIKEFLRKSARSTEKEEELSIVSQDGDSDNIGNSSSKESLSGHDMTVDPEADDPETDDKTDDKTDDLDIEEGKSSFEESQPDNESSSKVSSFLKNPEGEAYLYNELSESDLSDAKNKNTSDYNIAALILRSMNEFQERNDSLVRLLINNQREKNHLSSQTPESENNKSNGVQVNQYNNPTASGINQDSTDREEVSMLKRQIEHLAESVNKLNNGVDELTKTKERNPNLRDASNEDLGYRNSSVKTPIKPISEKPNEHEASKTELTNPEISNSDEEESHAEQKDEKNSATTPNNQDADGDSDPEITEMDEDDNLPETTPDDQASDKDSEPEITKIDEDDNLPGENLEERERDYWPKATTIEELDHLYSIKDGLGSEKEDLLTYGITSIQGDPEIENDERMLRYENGLYLANYGNYDSHRGLNQFYQDVSKIDVSQYDYVNSTGEAKQINAVAVAKIKSAGLRKGEVHKESKSDLYAVATSTLSSQNERMLSISYIDESEYMTEIEDHSSKIQKEYQRDIYYLKRIESLLNEEKKKVEDQIDHDESSKNATLDVLNEDLENIQIARELFNGNKNKRDQAFKNFEVNFKNRFKGSDLDYDKIIREGQNNDSYQKLLTKEDMDASRAFAAKEFHSHIGDIIQERMEERNRYDVMRENAAGDKELIIGLEEEELLKSDQIRRRPEEKRSGVNHSLRNAALAERMGKTGYDGGKRQSCYNSLLNAELPADAFKGIPFTRSVVKTEYVSNKFTKAKKEISHDVVVLQFIPPSSKDTFFVAIPNTPYLVKVMKSRDEGDSRRSSNLWIGKGGKEQQTPDCEANDIFISEDTVYTLDENSGKYIAKDPKSSETDTKDNLERLEYQMKKLQIKAVYIDPKHPENDKISTFDGGVVRNNIKSPGLSPTEASADQVIGREKDNVSKKNVNHDDSNLDLTRRTNTSWFGLKKSNNNNTGRQ